jgi:hypothetical protein
MLAGEVPVQTTRAEPDFSRLVLLATRLERLDAEAWARIAARCAALDGQSLDGILGRAELLARSIVPVTSPYSQPGVQPALSAWFTGMGIASELAALIDDATPERYERRAAQLREKAGATKKDLGEAAFLVIRALAARNRRRHPGLAAAIRAIAYAVLAGREPDANLEAVYAPFEPELPFASLAGASGHAA